MSNGKDDIPEWQRKLIENDKARRKEQESGFDTRPRFTAKDRQEYLDSLRSAETPAPHLRPGGGAIRSGGDAEGRKPDSEILKMMDRDITETARARLHTRFSRDDLDRT